MEKDTIIVEELLPRYCAGFATDEEKKIVEEWLTASDENYRIGQQIHTVYLATDTMRVQERVDTEQALAKVTSRMSVRIPWFTWVQRVAAVLLIPVLIAFCYQNFKKPAPDVRMVEVKTNPGMTTTFTLPDGSVVSLNSESSLVYPASFEGNIRNVELRGEAFFSVTKDKRKRFIVSTPHKASIEVLGTVFNVEAFEKDSVISTTLVEGKVNFIYAGNMKKETIPLLPGQKLIYNSNSRQARLNETNGISETAWKDGKIIFSDTPLPEALHMLEKRYNVEFVIRSNRFEGDSYTGFFKHQRLERILEVFEISSNIKWRYVDSENTSDVKTKIEIY